MQAAALGAALPTAPPATEAGLVAVFAATADHLDEPTRASLRRLESAADVRIATAAGVVGVLSRGLIPVNEDLNTLARIDEEAADYLASIADWPGLIRAVELVRELCARVVGERLG
jgi:hypothetical protein